MNMSDWRSKKMRKKGKGSQTPGKSKGPNCRTTPMQNYMAKRSRSYKHPRYSEWCQKFNGNKPNSNMGG